MNLTGYRNNFDELLNLLSTLTTEQLNFIPAPGKWSVHEIVAHLADVEVQCHVRIRTILANKIPYMINYDQMEWSVILDYNKIDPEESIEVITLMRRVNYNLLSRIPGEYFQKKGIHSVRGEMTLEEMVCFYTQHVYKHLDQIKKNLDIFNGKIKC